MILEYETFRSHLIDDSRRISYEDFVKKTNLNRLWDVHMKEDDIRKVAFSHNKKAFIDFYYEYAILGIDNILKSFFDKRISCKSVPNFDYRPIPVKNGKISIVPDGTRYFRSLFNEKMVKCTNRYGFSLENLFQRLYYNGHLLDVFFVPSVFKDYDRDNMSYVPDSLIVTIRTKVSLVSIFSPKLYRSFLLHCKNLSNADCKNVLFPCASWGIPVVAAKDMGFDYLDIVDVMPEVLDGCHTIYSDIHTGTGFFDDSEPYKLNTYCIPSEKMTTVLPRKYDIIFSCPPYFDMEIYETDNEQQSTSSYSTYESWLEKYWQATIDESNKVLNDNGIFGFVMANYVEGKYIANDMIEIAKTKFELIDNIKLKTISKNNASQQDHRFESAFFFRRLDR